MNDNAKTVRNFSVCGPCIPQGELIRETARFYVFRERMNYGYGDAPRERRLMKRTPQCYSPAHVEPCPSCRDHVRTQYPNGYMD